MAEWLEYYYGFVMVLYNFSGPEIVHCEVSLFYCPGSYTTKKFYTNNYIT